MLGRDVTQYGVRPGSPDDQTVKLQRAIDEAARAQAPLAVPPGVYRTGLLRLQSGTQLVGVRGATKLIFSGGASMLQGEGANNVGLTGITFDGGGISLPERRGLVHIESARGVDKAIPFYQKVFGWTPKANDMGPGQPPYTEFQLGGESVAGGQEMQAMVPPQVPSYWLVYFTVADVDKSFKTATQAGARELVAPMEFPGGRFAILTDPQGASFGLLKMAPR